MRPCDEWQRRRGDLLRSLLQNGFQKKNKPEGIRREEIWDRSLPVKSERKKEDYPEYG